MKNATDSKPSKISGAAYVAIQADLVSREGAVSAQLADLFFQCAATKGARTVEEWNALVIEARRAEVSIAEVIEFAEP